MKSRRHVGSPASTWTRSSLTLTDSRTVGRRSQTPASSTKRRRHPGHAGSPASAPTVLPQSGQRTRAGSGELIHDLLVDLAHAVHGHVPAEVPIDSLRRRRAEFGEERGVAQQLQDPLDEPCPVVLGDEEPAASVIHHLPERGHPEGDDRLAAGHRLLRRQRKAFEELRKYENVRQVEDPDLLRLGYVPREDHGAVEAELPDERGEFAAQRPGADPDERDRLGGGTPDLRERLEEEKWVLAVDEGSKAQENSLALEAVARLEGRVFRHRRVLRPHAAVHDGHVIRAQRELVGELTPG